MKTRFNINERNLEKVIDLTNFTLLNFWSLGNAIDVYWQMGRFMKDFAEIAGLLQMVIDKDTNIRDFKNLLNAMKCITVSFKTIINPITYE